MDSILGSLVATITIGFIYFMFRRKSLPIFKKNKRQLLVELIPTVIFCIFFPKVIKIAVIFFISWDYFIYYRLSQWEEKFYEIKIFKQKNLNQFMADCYKLVYFLGFIIDVKCDMIFPFPLWESSDIWYNV